MTEVTSKELRKIADELKEAGIEDLDSDISTDLAPQEVISSLLRQARKLKDYQFKSDLFSSTLEKYSVTTGQVALLLSHMHNLEHLSFLMEIYPNVVDKEKFLSMAKRQMAYGIIDYEKLKSYTESYTEVELTGNAELATIYTLDAKTFSAIMGMGVTAGISLTMIVLLLFGIL